MRELVVCLIILSGLAACKATGPEKGAAQKLPYLGRAEYVGEDTIFHTIADYKFLDQDSNWVTPQTFEDKIYVSDFFFTSCPTICPIMKTQMLRVYEKYKSNPQVGILSHTIDPEYDTVAVLREFARRLGVESEKWHFVTGEKEDIYKIGQTSYLVTTIEDSSQPGGFLHSGAFVLIDKERRLRGIYDGTKAEKVALLLEDIDILLKEYEK